MYGIFIIFAHRTGSKLSGLKKWPFWYYWEIVDFLAQKSRKPLILQGFSGTVAILRSNHGLTTQI
jgi:hypothetical protein